MESLLRTPKIALLIILALLSLAVASCTPNANAEIISPDLGEKLAAAEAGSEVVIQPTPEPKRLADLSPEEITAGLPPAIADALANADPSHGAELALQYGCVGCHSLDPAQQMTGPTWHNIGDTAIERVPDMSPALYLYESIVDPNSFVVPGYPANIMPQNYGETLSEQEIADLIAYMLEQHGQP